MEIISKQAARDIGQKYFFTGEPCKRGHVAERSVKSGDCQACNRERAEAQYRAKQEVRAAEKAPLFDVPAEYESYPRTRSEAKLVCRTQYFTGYPCEAGHRLPRWTTKGVCVECARLWTEEYNAKNKSHVETLRRAAAWRNREKRIQATREWKKKNQEAVAAYNAQYRAGEWKDLTLGRGGRATQATPSWLSAAQRQEIKDIYLAAQQRSLETGVKHHVDHEVPLVGPFVCGLHVPWNLKITEAKANLEKGRQYDGYTPAQVWVGMLPDERQQFVESVVSYYTTKGFPHFPRLSAAQISQSIFRGRGQATKGLIQDGIIRRTNTGVDVANAYFPHMFDVRCNNAKTAQEVFRDPTVLREVIEYRLKHGDYMTDNGLRKALCTYHGVQRASNFRPTAAAALYVEFAGSDAVVYDPCAGWGGRLLGAAMARNVKKYIACDPSVETGKGLWDLSGDVGGHVDVELHEICAEEFSPNESVDFVFTSPPYFDHEKYAEESTQSFKQWPSPQAWKEGFLRPMIRNAVEALKVGGAFCLNVANVPSYKTLEEDTLAEMISAGLTHEQTLLLELASMGNRGKFEPVFVCRKVVG